MVNKQRWIVVAVAIILLLIGFFFLAQPSLKPYALYQPAEQTNDSNALSVKFLGVTTLVFDDGETVLMTDGFFSRPSFLRTFFWKIEPDKDRIVAALGKAEIDQVNAIFVAHSHHDHAMDAASVAQEKNASVYGSYSTLRIALGQNFPEERYTVFKDGDTYNIGKFKVKAIATPHSPDPLFSGIIHKPLKTPARVKKYLLGGNYSFHIQHGEQRFLVVASANYEPGKFRNLAAETVFLGIGLLGKQSNQFIEAYWNEVVLSVGARTVIPIHWDDFTRPLDKPLKPALYPFDDFEYAMRMLSEFAERDGMQLRLPKAFDPMTFGPS